MRFSWLGGLLLALLLITHTLAAPTVTVIDFTSTAPAGVSLDEIWHGLGVDTTGRVYVAVTSRYGDPPGDVAIFRYTPSTQAKEYLASLRAVTAAQGNLLAGERIAKVHTDILPYNGKLYFASHDFHGGENPATIRGAHFYSYDPSTNTWDDLSKDNPGGVSAPNQGIIAMDVLRVQNKLAGLTWPDGRVVLYDLATRGITTVNAPTSLSNTTRKVLATSAGKVYFSYYPPLAAPMYVLTVATGQIAPSGYTFVDGTIQGRVTLANGTVAYLMDESGGLYRFTVATEVLTSLGSMLPAGVTMPYYDGAFVMSNDEQVLFTMPNEMTSLFAYNLTTGARTTAATFGQGYSELTGGVVDQAGVIYLGNHNYQPGGARLLAFSEIPGSPAATTTLPAPTNLRIRSIVP